MNEHRSTEYGVVDVLALPGVTPALAAAVASLPGRFRLTDSPSGPYVAWVTGPGWEDVTDTALSHGARAVVVDHGGPVGPQQIARFAAAPVVWLGTWTHAPQLRTFAEALHAPQAPAPDWVEVLVVDGAPDFVPRAALWDAVAMLTAAGLPIGAVPTVTLSPMATVGPAVTSAPVITSAPMATVDPAVAPDPPATRGVVAVLADGALAADAGGARFHLSLVHRPGAEPCAVIKAFSHQTSVEATMGDPLVAWPGRVLITTAATATVVGARYETPRRVALLEIYASLARDLRLTPGSSRSDGLPEPGRLALHAAASELLSRVVWPDESRQLPTQPEGNNQ